MSPHVTSGEPRMANFWKIRNQGTFHRFLGVFNLFLASSPYSEGDLSQEFYIWVFPKIVVPQNGWFIMVNPIKMDDLGGIPIFGNTHILNSSVCSFTWFYCESNTFLGTVRPYPTKRENKNHRLKSTFGRGYVISCYFPGGYTFRKEARHQLFAA